MRDEEARRFEAIFLPFLDAAFNLARWIVRQDEDAEDVTQEAYLRAFKSFHGFHGENGKAWLLTIVRNTAYTWVKKRSNDNKLIPFEEEVHGDLLTTSQPAPGLTAQQECLHRALDKLPTEYREIIVLFEINGLSYKELATALEIPIGTVMSRLTRARRSLHQQLGPFPGQEEAHGMH